MTEQERKEAFDSLTEKTKFYKSVGERVGKSRGEKPLSHHSVRAWFSPSELSTKMPTDKKTLKIIDSELKKASKNVPA